MCDHPSALKELPTEAPAAQSVRTDVYRLIVFGHGGARILLHNFALPEVEILHLSRPAQEITSVLREKWSESAVLLWSSQDEESLPQTAYAVLEAYDQGRRVHPDLSWTDIGAAISFLDETTARLIENTYSVVTGKREELNPAPFAKLGWVHSLCRWLSEMLGSALAESLVIVQVNGSKTFNLIRFGTEPEAVWFKAVGNPNLREFPITLLLSERLPGYLPTILATDHRINGWLMKNFGSSRLCDSSEAKIWAMVAQRLGQLQVESINCASELLNAGCRDLRAENLINVVDPFFATMASLMELQEKPSPPPLTLSELETTARHVAEALRIWIGLEIPDTVGHLDPNPGNVLIDSCSCAFIDWAEGYVGIPHLTLEYFFSHLSRSKVSDQLKDAVRSAYLEGWRSTGAASRIEQALELSPLLAVFAYATANEIWRQKIRQPRASAYLRSLTRRMRREAKSLFGEGI